ncbi:TetR/AcrR family transcriptional regulator [Actinotalea sp. M2MS4P-6]|uniref:TetR/AcrR family transcriptional regulator n=1 Tax=Actinotalea sp. M2MS4P-6 TaxID=2983762 RepID=UPI0021E43C71|nr:TetR/AcrR family transcriptional regulator [Actinotalea sp. M2MS4P-6]MCV2394258.1 TetR/AcrR family transcriptional regulator [Actinotalea sp. M2MS4P-6]
MGSSSRRDAVRNRAALVAAAEEVFREAGATAPLHLVAARANLGRGTLYRHFPDRAALVAAVYERRVDALEALAPTLPAERSLEQLVVEIAHLQLDVPGLLSAVQGSADAPNLLAEVELRTRALLDAALATARDLAEVRDDVTLDDVLLTFAMIDGVIAGEAPERVEASVHRALRLALRALLSTDRPPPAPRLVDRPDAQD